MEIRTDLAVEMRESKMESEARRDAGEIDGVNFFEQNDGDVKISTIDVLNESGEKKLGKPRGRYVTIAFGDVSSITFDEYEHICKVISESIESLVKRTHGDVKSVLVCGLGNRRFAADAVGVISAERTVVTRHIKMSDEKVFRGAGFFDVCAIMPGVVAQTGIETLELVRSAAKEAAPDLIIVIDALAARRTERLHGAADRYRHISGIGRRKSPQRHKQRDDGEADDSARRSHGHRLEHSSDRSA